MWSEAAEGVPGLRRIMGLYLVESVGFTSYVLPSYVSPMHFGPFYFMSDYVVCDQWLVSSLCYALDLIFVKLFGELMVNLSRRKWCILCWNVHGLNADNRQRAVRSKIDESECDIICLQETKCESFDWRLVRKFFPKHFDSFAYSPLVGTFGGIIVLWNFSIFLGVFMEMQRFGIIINFTSVHDNANWTLVSVYGPFQGLLRDHFVFWLYNLNIRATNNWLLIGYLTS
jgi:hypothetical protein